MRVFVAGGSGVLGRRLVPQLLERGHEVWATATTPVRLWGIKQSGAHGVVMDGLDADSVSRAVAAARPDVVVHQMTAISVAHAGKIDLRHPDRWFAITNRLRSEGTDNLLAAATANGAHLVSQGYASWNGELTGGWVKTEEDPLDVSTQQGLAILAQSERKVVAAGGAVLRYGAFYGPGAIDDQVALLRRRQYPLVGDGAGHSSWVHLDDAAAATVIAVERRAHGVFNIVDDDPAPASEWLPWLARCAGAKPPMRIPVWLARRLAGEQAVVMMTQGRAFSNAKAKRELGWTLRYPSWRDGFEKELSGADDDQAPAATADAR